MVNFRFHRWHKKLIWNVYSRTGFDIWSKYEDRILFLDLLPGVVEK
jgi:hypothetical protein